MKNRMFCRKHLYCFALKEAQFYGTSQNKDDEKSHCSVIDLSNKDISILLLRHFNDVREVQKFRTLIPGTLISVIIYNEIEIYTKVNDKQNKHVEPKGNQLKGKLMNQNNGKGRP